MWKRKMELSLEVKLVLSRLSLSYTSIATNADQRKWRQIRISAMSKSYICVSAFAGQPSYSHGAQDLAFISRWLAVYKKDSFRHCVSRYVNFVYSAWQGWWFWWWSSVWFQCIYGDDDVWHKVMVIIFCVLCLRYWWNDDVLRIHAAVTHHS